MIKWIVHEQFERVDYRGFVASFSLRSEATNRLEYLRFIFDESRQFLDHIVRGSEWDIRGRFLSV